MKFFPEQEKAIKIYSLDELKNAPVEARISLTIDKELKDKEIISLTAALLKGKYKVEELFILRCTTYDDELINLIKALSRSRSLQTLNLGTRYDPGIEFAQAIANLIRTSPLYTLELWTYLRSEHSDYDLYNEFGAKGIEFIAKAIEEQFQLKKLKIVGYRLSFTTTLGNALKTCYNLESLNLSYNRPSLYCSNNFSRCHFQ